MPHRRSVPKPAWVQRAPLATKPSSPAKNPGACPGVFLWCARQGALTQHWPTIKAKLLAREYMPSPVRRVDIPKPQGGVRTLGIPTLTDRLIQQALHQVLAPIFEAEFSGSSYGFRPGRNAHPAVKAAQQYVAEGRRIVWSHRTQRQPLHRR